MASNNGRTIDSVNGLEDDEASAIAAMTARGIDEAEQLLSFASTSVILDWCRWFDGQPRAGKGLLAGKIRSGETPPQSKRSLVEEQREYGERICGWLSRHFPDLCEPVWGPHPAAVVAVIHLHAELGKGSLRPREHGPAIRAAVKAWEAKWAA